MANYRIYRLDMSGNIISGFDARCADDEAACAEAVTSADGCDVEVWSDFRRVARLAPYGKRSLH